MSEYGAVAVFDGQRHGHFVRVTWGGYPATLGVLLLNYYEDEDRARSLISLGDCYRAGRFIGQPFACRQGVSDDEWKRAAYEWSEKNECCLAYVRDFRRLAERYMPKPISNGIVEFYGAFAVGEDGESAHWAEHLYAWIDGVWYYRPANDPTGAWVVLRHAIRVDAELCENPSVRFEVLEHWGGSLDWYEGAFHRVARLDVPAP